ncbi:PilN domain-containing protein [Flocculibacter collagenilyticus]|uniref:PilN domain-containing protein n=1 Tax=Flocculibacter collagenilyticus TaxID=2744479 RepID=UPI0018F2F3EF|nr:PilN domain-containing protein [Flocculibacter collagenilyticus]
MQPKHTKYYINLYTKALHPDRSYLTLPKLLLTASLVLVFVFSLSGYLMWENSIKEQRLDVLIEKVDVLTDDIELTQQQLAVKQPDPFLLQQKQKLNQSLATRQNLLTHLKQYQQHITFSYATVMTELAKYHHPDIWLTHFSFNQHQQISLTGLSVSTAAIPAWLEGLGQSSYFSGRSFSQVLIQQQNNDIQVLGPTPIADVPNAASSGAAHRFNVSTKSAAHSAAEENTTTSANKPLTQPASLLQKARIEKPARQGE